MEVVVGTKIKGLNMLNQLGWLIWSYIIHICLFIYVNARTKEKLIKVIVKYLKMLPLKSDGTVSPCRSFPF